MLNRLNISSNYETDGNSRLEFEMARGQVTCLYQGLKTLAVR